jgi:CHAT domain-containing protein
LLNPLTGGTNQELSNQIRQLSLSEINQVPAYLRKIPQDAVLIYPLVLGDRLEIILFSANKLPISAKVKISKAEFEELIKDFRSDLQNIYSPDAKISGKKVYNLLLKPLESQLNQLKPKIILYAPDDILRYIPLSALYDGKQWLIEKYQVDNLIAYSLYQPNSSFIPSSPRIFAGAFGGKDGETRFGAKGLAASIPEITNIAKIFSNVTRLSDRNFTAAAAKNQVVGNNIIHFATHAEFNSGSPLDSYILFGDGSKVTLSEISSWQLKGVDLVVLSACETGIGTFGTVRTGTEVLGFGYQVQRAGAKAAIASLWTVSDGGTQLLMDEFYINLKQNLRDQNILSAMRTSQLKMINKAISKGEPNYNHPYFWSSFILIGTGI